MKGIVPPLGCALALLLSLLCASAQIAPELREEGVLYFEGNLPDKITTTLHTTTTVYARRNFQIVLATLYPGQKIELTGMSAEGYLLKTSYQNNTIDGWIRPEDLPTGIDPALFAEAKKNQAHHDAIAVAVANKDVIRGMTLDEVKQSVGQPEQVSSRVDAQGSALSWVYITYRQVPQYSYALNPFGRAVQQIYYVKIPVGQMTVDFANGIVVSVEQHTTDPNSPGVVTN